MSELVTDCPRCGAKLITFEVKGETFLLVESAWKYWYEIFCVCRRCHKGTIFVVSQKKPFENDDGFIEISPLRFKSHIGNAFSVERYVSVRDVASIAAPEHLPEDLTKTFEEGAACFAIGCYNAASTMFRLCIDIATRGFVPSVQLPEDTTMEAQPSAWERRNLGPRIDWLITNGKLPEGIRDLASCVREDGNDGAHQGTLTKADAEDLIDFTYEILERLITDPARLELAGQRRLSRRQKRKT